MLTDFLVIKKYFFENKYDRMFDQTCRERSFELTVMYEKPLKCANNLTMMLNLYYRVIISDQLKYLYCHLMDNHL